MEKEREEQVISLCQKLIQQKSYSAGSECFTTAIRASDAKDMADDWTGRKLSV